MINLKYLFNLKYLVAVTALVVCSAASAAPVYVGSWQVDQGPSWYGSPPNGPLAYTGQEAAALLFGGSASNYVISTIDTIPADINGLAWYSIIGYPGGTAFTDSYSNKYLGLYYGPPSGYPSGDINASASAYVQDNAIGVAYTNYAFSVAVPEPETYAMLLVGLGLIGFTVYRRKNQTA
jgi:hypothetical protein